MFLVDQGLFLGSKEKFIHNKSAMAFRLVQNMMQTTLLQVLLLVVQIIKQLEPTLTLADI
ncbi:hypothetical protein CGSHiR3021_03418 [Haemophilus influenzae 22.4-21]|uniref:Uncharacterized protein n=1 Tax=Haemophilus influenzae 22.4-21 TaxID=375063 RepID=A4NYT3_HAEIF|nr:hypothetical protein CGSHiR3021_03418 [Haemophilus influenzae 22.4-21]